MRSPAQALLVAISLGLGCHAPAPATPDLVPAGDAATAEGDLAGADLRGGAADLRPADPGMGSLKPGTTTITLTAGGQVRSAILYVPAAITGGPVPLVLALHGNGDTSDNFVAALGLKALADAAPFVLVAPQGIPQTLTIAGQTIRVSWDAYRGAGENIDLALLAALRQQLLGSGSIDGRRVLVFGYSQGGYMAFRFGMEAAGDLSCTAVAAASNPLPGSRLVPDAPRKIPVALQIGTQDPGLAGAQRTRMELEQNHHPVQYNEVPGAGHVPFPGDPRTLLDYCRGQTLP